MNLAAGKERRKQRTLAVLVFIGWGVASIIAFEITRSVALQVAVSLLAVVASAFFLLAEIRLVRSLDELQRKIELEALAVAYPLAVLLIMLLGLLERVSAFPPLEWSYRRMWPMMVIICFLIYFLGLAIARRRYK